MRNLALFLLCVLIIPLGSLSRADEPETAGSTAVSAVLPVIAVSDFTGEDPATSRFLADSLLTDLSQSSQLHMVERTELRRALNELKLQDTGLFEPKQIQALGKLIRADQLIVGSYLIRDNQIMINVRLLDIPTGRVVTGGASNINGDARDLLTVVHLLAHIFHYRITGSEFAIDGEGAIKGYTAPARRPEYVRPISARSTAPVHTSDPYQTTELYSVIAAARRQTRALNYSDTPAAPASQQARTTVIAQIPAVRAVPTPYYVQPSFPLYTPQIIFPIRFHYSSPSYSVSYIRRSAYEQPRLRVSYGVRNERRRRY